MSRLRITTFRTLASALVFSGILAFDAATARAQFPIFNGGEVLTPFGQRGSDGSYLNRPAQRQNPPAARSSYRAPSVAQQPRVYQNRYAAPAQRYYQYTPGTAYGTYPSNGYVYRRPFLGRWR